LFPKKDRLEGYQTLQPKLRSMIMLSEVAHPRQ
jgi:hypothetical protein